mmetsp:Transcript_43298/g.41686  ORF Transcript_43298/g.41686 Transcript_43298/m.41686 type:complete len:306 (-) Transcript_43298:978-1895(-)
MLFYDAFTDQVPPHLLVDLVGARLEALGPVVAPLLPQLVPQTVYVLFGAVVEGLHVLGAGHDLAGGLRVVELFHPHRHQIEVLVPIRQLHPSLISIPRDVCVSVVGDDAIGRLVHKGARVLLVVRPSAPSNVFLGELVIDVVFGVVEDFLAEHAALARAFGGGSLHRLVQILVGVLGPTGAQKLGQHLLIVKGSLPLLICDEERRFGRPVVVDSGFGGVFAVFLVGEVRVLEALRALLVGILLNQDLVAGILFHLRNSHLIKELRALSDARELEILELGLLEPLFDFSFVRLKLLLHLLIDVSLF